jgi:hypothetical protein
MMIPLWSCNREIRIGDGKCSRRPADGYEISVGRAPRWEDESKQRAYLGSVAAEGVT